MTWKLLAIVTTCLLLVGILTLHSRRSTTAEQDVRVVDATSTSNAVPVAQPSPAENRGAPSTTLASETANADRNAETPPPWMQSDAEMEPKALYVKVRREPRDSNWASAEERAIRYELAKIPYIGGEQPPRILCATSVCEVSGATVKGLPDANANVTWTSLQSVGFRDALAKQNLTQVAGIFGGGGKEASTYTLYMTRASKQ